MQINDRVKFQQVTITLESDLDIAIMLAMLERCDTLDFDEEVTRELFKITGIDERRNVDKNLVIEFTQNIERFLTETVEYNKELKEED
jgi:hypothetical protein